MAPLDTGVSRNGVTVIALALGRLNDPANTFYELFSSPAPGAPFALTTPTGTTTNGGIVISNTSGLVAIRQFDRLLGSVVMHFSAGHETGVGQLGPALGSGPSTVANNPVNGAVGLLTATSSVLEASSLTSTFRTVATLATMRAAAPSCAPSAITAIAYGSDGTLALGLHCTKSGGTGLVVRAGTRFVEAPGSASSSVTVLRLDAGPQGAIDGLATTRNGVEAFRTRTLPATQLSVAWSKQRTIIGGPVASTAYSDAFGGSYSVTTNGSTPEGSTTRLLLTGSGSGQGAGMGVPSASGDRLMVPVVGGAGPVQVWITKGGTVHFRRGGEVQTLRVAVPYGSAS